jgi:thiol-disulfide isomerase/thioredoxin
LYGYDWEISEHKEGYTLTFMILPSSWYRIHSGTHGIFYQSLLEPFEPGSFFWTMRDYLILDEVFAPFRDVSVIELSVVDSADCYYITRQLNDQAIRELVVQKDTYRVLRSTSRIIEKALCMVQIISMDFIYDNGITLADSAFAPEYYVAKGYQLNIAEHDVAPVETTPLPEVNYANILLNYPLVGEGDDTTRLLDFKGKYLLLDFWYASCLPCLRAMPEIQELAKQYPEVQLLGVNCYDLDIRTNLTTRLREKQIEIPLLYASRDLVNVLGITSFPTYLMVTPDQNVRYMSGGVEGVGIALAEVFGR